MSERPRGSIRLWQTGSFIIVIVVAMLTLSGTLSAGINSTLTRMTETAELRNASALAQRLAPQFPLETKGLEGVRQAVMDYRGIYGGGIWVYDADGRQLESETDGGPVEAVLHTARDAVLSGAESYAATDLRTGGWVVAAKPLRGTDGKLDAVVVTASSVDQAVSILQATRDRLWVAFWVSLVIASLLGFGLSELIRRRMQAISEGAAAIAAGHFDQRLTAGLVPDEVRDITASYNSMAETLGDAFEEVRESRRAIAVVVESMAEGVIAFEGDGTVRVTNPEAQRLLDAPDATLLGLPVERISDDAAVIETVRAALAGTSSARTVPLGPYVVLLHCTPLRDAAGNSEGAVLLLADVTEQYRIEDAQRRFVADASHEMRTPIAGLKGMLELLIDGAKDVPAVRDDFLNTMQSEVDRLGRLVTDLLTLAQLDSGSMRVAPTPQFAADLLHRVTSLMLTLADQAGVHLNVVSPGDEVRVLADGDRIVQVLVGLTDNALKHSPAGGVVELSAVVHGSSVRFEVSDQGSGIEAAEIARVFERFYRTDEARTGRAGTGLGLAIAKEIVEAHGSSVDVRSTPGSGSVFGFELPLA